MEFTKINERTREQFRYDEGLRKYMLRVFTLMSVGLALTGAVAMFAGNSQPFIQMLYNITPDGRASMSGFGYLISFAPLLFVLGFSFGITRMRAETAKMLFWVFSVIMGMSLSTLFLSFTGESIARTFFIAASVFGAMSIYGYTTKKDLTAMGSFLFMGLIGIVVVSLVNLFVQSSALQFFTNLAGVFIFIGLTAFDVQRLKNIYYQFPSHSEEAISKVAIMGAFSLYMNFINLFIHLLHFFGDRK